jgi:competence protein ComEC
MRSLCLSILVGLVYDPLVAFDISFLLSLAATLGLMTLGRVFAVPEFAAGHPGLRLLWTSIAGTLSAMLPCSLVLALLSARISLVGILANAVAAPFGEVIALPLCLVHTVTWWWEPLESGLALVGSGALLVVRRVALFSASVSGFALTLPFPTAWHYFWLAQLVGLALELRGGGRLQRRLRWTGLALCTAGLLGTEYRTWRAGNPLGVLRLTGLDIGQGDSTLVDLPDGSLLLVDGGGFVGSPVDPGERVLLPLLRSRRRARVDVVLLSHPHPDHFGGLQAVLEKVEVGELWDTGEGERDGAGPAYAALLATARRRGVVVRRPSELCGQRTLGGARIDVLAPCPDVVAGRSANDNSFVLHIFHGAHAALLVGDAEEQAENELVQAHGAQLRSDFLKVGHHGSRTSSSIPFLDAVSPTIATVSCGMRNRFGHPHVEAIDRLERRVRTVVRTDRSGSFTWESDGEQAKLQTRDGLFTYRPAADQPARK